MGNYLTTDKVPNQGDMTTAQVEVLIGVVERFIEWYCQTIFYAKAWTKLLDGNGRQTLPTDFPHEIVSCTKIESVSSSGTLSELDATGYVIDPWFITRRSIIWQVGNHNYKFTGTIGNGPTDLDGNTNDWYKPNAIAEAVKLIVINILNEYYDTTAGGTAISTEENKYNSEKIGDYSYTLRNMQQADLSSKTPTGIFYVDNILLPPFVNRDPDLALIYDNPEEYIAYDSLWEVLFQ